MAKLIVKQHGKPIQELELVSGQEYLIGRAEDCAIILDVVKAISRHHIRISSNGETWTAELISKFGQLLYEGNSVTVVGLGHGVAFSVPPFEFAFESQTAQKAPASSVPELDSPSDETRPSNNTLVPVPVIATQMPEVETSTPVDFDEDDDDGNMESTRISRSSLKAILKVFYKKKSKPVETIELEGDRWIVGRGENCEVILENEQISREHFKIRLKSDGYFICDLGSANGTKLNGKRIPPRKYFAIHSGDQISIKKVTIEFEIQDRKFQNKMALVPKNMMMPHAAVPATFAQGQIPAVIKVEKEDSFAISSATMVKNKNFMKFAVGAVIALVLFIVLSGEEKKIEQKDQASKDPNKKELSIEQKAYIKDTFNLAMDHYKTGKYQLCLDEIHKIHEILPYYERSKEIEALCDEADRTEREVAERARKAEEAQQIQESIAKVVIACRAQMSEDTTSESMKACVQPAMDLNPDSSEVQQLMAEVQDKESKKKMAAAQKVEARKKLANCQGTYEKSKELASSGELRKSRESYGKLLKMTCPGFTQMEGAQRELASLQGQITTKVKELMQKCQSLYDGSKFKDAFAECTKAMDEDPQNGEASTLRNKVLSDLRREMKAVYEDSVLEESLGNVDSAKAKWKKILEDDVATDEYYLKAKRKLKTYGVGI